MSSVAKIPFGLDSSTGELVDVGSVERGNACGCICPSCQTPLVARQGDEVEWHFAHRSRNVHPDTQEECEYSFAVSVRMMIRQLADEGLSVRIPSYTGSVQAFREHTYRSEQFQYHVTDEKVVTLEQVHIGIEFEETTVDVLASVGKVPFVIFVSYEGRTVPPVLSSPSVEKCGILELNVNSLPHRFKAEKKGAYKQLLRHFLEEEVEGKRWVYHPREPQARQAAMEKRDEWLRRQESKAADERQGTHTRRKRKSTQGGDPSWLSTALGVGEATDMPEPRIAEYRCVMCNHVWTGFSRNCPNCDTHLYTTEVPSKPK